MALFGFGKSKKDELAELEKELGLGDIEKAPEEPKLNEDLMPKTPPGEPERPAFKEEGFEVKEIPKEEPKHGPIHPRDLELISAKLDSIRLMIDNMNERLKHIEKMEEEEYRRKKLTW